LDGIDAHFGQTKAAGAVQAFRFDGDAVDGFGVKIQNCRLGAVGGQGNALQHRSIGKAQGQRFRGGGIVKAAVEEQTISIVQHLQKDNLVHHLNL